MKDIIIIGAGPAGLTAAIYAVRYGLTVTVFEQLVSGGQVATTPEIENYPAVEKITGYDFSLKLHEQAVKLGVEIITERVISVDFTDRIKSIKTDTNTYTARSVIIANGAKRRTLNCNGEEEFTGRGVSYCATCDGAFYKGKDVVIVGGGNTALEDALFLSNICNKVYLVHRRDTFRGMKALENAVKNKNNIEIIFNSQVSKISGERTVNNVSILINNSEQRELAVSGIFIAIGTEPDNTMFKDIIELNKSGYIVAGEDCQTNLDGIYAAGDCRTKSLRQIVTATGDGAIAAFMAANYLNTQE